LHWAAKRNKPDIISSLIEKGANVNAEDMSGRTPLHLASKNNYKECIKKLLLGMADPSKKSKEGRLPIDLTTDKKCKFFINQAKIVKLTLTSSFILYIVWGT
jgi:ankyrin repeat protein